jgi:hypothetical protein
MPRRNRSRNTRDLPAAGGVTKPCPAGCGRRVQTSKAACSDDWARLPVRLKQAWNQARADEDTAGQERVLAAIAGWARRNRDDESEVA